jgi:hypothetical protein
MILGHYGHEIGKEIEAHRRTDINQVDVTVTQRTSDIADGGRQDSTPVRLISLRAPPQLAAQEFGLGLEYFDNIAGERSGVKGVTIVELSIGRSEDGMSREGEIEENRQNQSGILMPSVDGAEEF